MDDRLPVGWESKTDATGRVYYVDHINRKTQWERPFTDDQSVISRPNSISSIQRSRSKSREEIMREVINVEESSSVCSSTMSETESDQQMQARIQPTSYFLENAEIQEFAQEILPHIVMSRSDKNCFKCRGIMTRPTMSPHHCRSCGEIYCKQCCSFRIEIPLPEDEYDNGPVRCCEYCYRHLCTDDQNSLLRYLIILREPTVEDINKFKAARVLYMSICHEQVWSKEEENARRNCEAADKYPALHEAIQQIGGFDALWACIIPNLKDTTPPGLRSLAGRMISRIISRTTGPECFRSYYKHNTLALLISCLNHPNIAEGAAETLVSGFVRDINGHMIHFETQPHALNVVMDVMYRASPAVQTHLTNLFSFAIKWPRATVFIRQALNNGLLSLMSYMLKSEALSTQESAIGAVTALVQKVSVVPDLSDLTAQVVDAVLGAGMIDTVTRITSSVEFRVDSKAMFHVVTLYELLAIHAAAHPQLYAPIHSAEQPARGIGSGGKYVQQVSAYTQALKLLNYLSEKGENMDIYAKTISSILTFCCYIISVAPRKESFIEGSSLFKSCCRVLCKSRQASLKQETINIFYLFAARTTAIANSLLQSRSHVAFAEALMNFTIDDASSRKRIDGAADSENDADISALNCSLDVLAFTLAQFCTLGWLTTAAANSAANGIAGQGALTGSDDSDNFTYCTIGSDAWTEVDVHSSLRDLFMRVVSHPTIWPCIVDYLHSRNRQKIMFAARLIHVLAGYKDVRLLSKLHEVCKAYSIVDVLMAAVARMDEIKVSAVNIGPFAAADVVVMEMLLLALGSLMGSSAIFPWEVDGLTLAPLHATPSAFTPLSASNTGLGANRNPTFLPPGKAPLPVSPHGASHSHLQVIEREERVLLQAQKRANLEHGSTATELPSESSCLPGVNAGICASVFAVERQLRVECVEKLSPCLQAIIENDDPANISASIAALRILQIVLHDASDRSAPFVALAKHLAAQIHHYCFVTLLPEMNKVQVVIALDVLGLMTHNADFSIDEAVQIVTDLLQTQDSVVRCKALDTLVYCSLNPTCLASIGSFCLGPLAHMLRYMQHLRDPTLDSVYIVCSVLFILSRLVVDEATCNIILQSAIFNGLVDILKLDDGVLQGQAVYDSHIRTLVQPAQTIVGMDTPTNSPRLPSAPLVLTISTIRRYNFRCIHAFAAYHSCRSILLAANIPHFLLQQLARDRIGIASLPWMLTKGSVVEVADEDSQNILHSIFLLSFKAHRSLKDSLSTVPEACHSLLLIWAGTNAQLSYKAMVVLMRCGVSGEPLKTLSASRLRDDMCDGEAIRMERAYEALSPPWITLVDTCQVYFLCDLIEENVTSSCASHGDAALGTVIFDEHTDAQVKVAACEALHLIVRRTNADPAQYATVQETMRDLCTSDFFVPRLEAMIRLTPTAGALITDIRTLSNLNFDDDPMEMCNILTRQMSTKSLVQKFQGFSMLAEYCRKKANDISDISAALPVAPICEAFGEVTRYCLIKSLQRARSTFMADLPDTVELMMNLITIHNVFSKSAATEKIMAAAAVARQTSHSAGKEDQDDLGVRKTLGYGPDCKDYILKSICDALTVLSGHESSAQVLIKSRTLIGSLLQTLTLKLEFIHARRAQTSDDSCPDSMDRSMPSQLYLEDEEIEVFKAELVIVNCILDVYLHLVQYADTEVTEQLLLPSTAATGEDETGLEVLLTLSVDIKSVALLAYRPDTPRNVKFTLKNFLMRPIEPSLGEQLFFLLYHLSCGIALSTAVTYITHGSFMSELSRHLRDDIDNWLSLVPHLLAGVEERRSASPGSGIAAVDADSPDLELESTLSSPTRTSDKPTQSMEAYVADILSAKLAMLTNLSRVATGRDRIFGMQAELQSLLQLITLYVELPDAKLIYSCLTLLLSLTPMIHQPQVKEKTATVFVSNAIAACFNAAARAEDLSVIEKALSLIQLLSHHKAGAGYLEAPDALGLAVRALNRVVLRVIPNAFFKRRLLKRSSSTNIAASANPANVVSPKDEAHFPNVCHKCVQLVARLLLLPSADLEKVGAVPGLMSSLLDILISAPRQLNWTPCALEAAELLQVLVLHPANATVCFEALLTSDQAMFDVSSESQALSEAVANINAALQPNLRNTLKLSAFRPVHVPSAHSADV